MSLSVKINGCFLKYRVFSSTEMGKKLGSFSKVTDSAGEEVLRAATRLSAPTWPLTLWWREWGGCL